MGISKILISIVVFIFFAFVGIAGLVFIYSNNFVKESASASLTVISNNTLNQQEQFFNPASLDWGNIDSEIPWESRDSHAVVVYNNKIWLMGGIDANGFVLSPGVTEYERAPHFSDVWSSIDGEHWNLVTKNAPWGERRSVQAVDFKGKIWLMGGWGPDVGCQNDVWSSSDGEHWIKETDHAEWPAREGHQLLVFNNKIWLMGGVRYDKRQLLNDVWYSEDGIHWTEATKNAGWSPRWDHAIAVFKNKMWLTGGMEFGNKILNDVWYSEDGISWSLALSSAPWGARQGHGSLEYKNKLWVLGRLDNILGLGGENDVWYSEDGISWYKTEKNPEWTGREDVCIFVFNDKIWVLGGMDKNWQWKNDVWYSK